MGKQRDYEVYVLDRAKDGLKPQLVRDLGALYLTGTIDDINELAPDVIIECTGAPSLIAGVLGRSAPSGIVCLVGIGGNHDFSFDIGQFNRTMVLNNDVVFGSVNANRRHYETGGEGARRADKAWLGAADLAARAAVELAGSAGTPARTTSKWSSISRFRIFMPQCRPSRTMP